MPNEKVEEEVEKPGMQMLECYGGSAERPWAFIKIFYGLKCSSAEVLWRLLHREWSAFDKIPHREFGAILRIMRDSWREDYFSSEDRAFYNSLPDEIEIWRGQQVNESKGLSWTTNRDVAIKFAKGTRFGPTPSPLLLRGRIHKKHVALTPQDREESEVVLFDVRNVRRLEREALQPVSFEQWSGLDLKRSTVTAE